MIKLAPSSRTLLSAAVWLGLASCADTDESEAPVDSLRQALDVCNETVPPTRFIDGFPAYAQCDAFANSAIYSNNGIDTSATKVGPDWYRTQYSGGYQCTELATRYFHFKWKVDYVPRGNAGEWCNTEPPASSGVVKTSSPVHGDLMVLAGGSCGATQSTGHVNVVDTVDMAGGKLVAVEQNMARRGTYKISCAACFLHAVANDGAAPVDAGAPVVDAGNKPPVDAGPSKPPEASSRDAGARDAGSVDASKPSAPEPTDEDEEEDAGKPSEDDDVAPNDEPRPSADGCSLSSPSTNLTAILMLLALALLQRRRTVRVRARGCASSDSQGARTRR